jgi:hypothetical protein
MPLFEIAILEKPSKKDKDAGGREQLIFGPKAVVAHDEQSAAISAVMNEGLKFDPTRSEVIVRPFA